MLKSRRCAPEGKIRIEARNLSARFEWLFLNTELKTQAVVDPEEDNQLSRAVQVLKAMF